MGVRLEGRKKFHSNGKDKDYFQLILSFPGDSGCGRWFDSPFVSEDIFSSVNPSDFGKEVVFDYAYQGGRSPVITGYTVKK